MIGDMFFLRKTILYIALPDCDNLSKVKVIIVHLGNKNCCQGFIECCAIHIDCRSHWQYKACHPLIYLVVLLQASECDW